MALRLARTRSVAAVILFYLASSGAHAGSLLNGGFDTPASGLAPPNYGTSITGAFGAGGPSSAADWILYNYVDDTTSTELLPSTDPSGGGSMLHMTSTGAHNSIYQVYAQTPATTASIDIYVLSGSVTVELSDTVTDTQVGSASTTGVGQWVTLSINAASPTNLFSVFTGPNGGDFYIDNAAVSGDAAVPEPSSALLALLGLLGLTAIRRRWWITRPSSGARGR